MTGTFMISRRGILLRMRNVLGKICRENQNTYFIFSNVIFENRDFHETMRKKKHGRGGQATDHIMIRRVGFACWMTKVTNTLRICNTVSPQQQWLSESA